MKKKEGWNRKKRNKVNGRNIITNKDKNVHRYAVRGGKR